MHINMQNDVSFVGGILFAKSLGAGHLNLVIFENLFRGRCRFPILASHQIPKFNLAFYMLRRAVPRPLPSQ